MSPAGSGAAGREPAASPLLTIGEVLAVLHADFPDVTHSKIRFLEDRGLVSPQRTPSGYRKFTPADVERLRRVLSLQRDQYLPLRVIAAHLEAASQEPEETAPGAPGAPGGLGALGASGPQLRGDLLAAAGSAALLEALETHGLLPRPVEGVYPPHAADVVAAARQLAEHGVEPRHLRVLRSAAEREAALVEQVRRPLRHQQRPGAGERAEAVERDLVAALLGLHAAVLRSALDDEAAGRG